MRVSLQILYYYVIWDSTCYVSPFINLWYDKTIEGNFNKQEWLYAKQHVKKDGT